MLLRWAILAILVMVVHWPLVESLESDCMVCIRKSEACMHCSMQQVQHHHALQSADSVGHVLKLVRFINHTMTNYEQQCSTDRAEAHTEHSLIRVRLLVQC